MQVGVDHPADIVRPMAQITQRILQPGSSVLPRILDPVDVDELVVLLVTDSRIDEDQAVVVLDEEAPQSQRYAILLVRRSPARPQRLGDDAEQRSPVEVLGAALEGVARQAPALEGRMGHSRSPRAVGPGSAGALNWRMGLGCPRDEAP